MKINELDNCEKGLVVVATLLFGFVCGLVITRAIGFQITIDEASTFFDFIQPFHILPPEAKWEANNHLLNSFLSALSVSLFGDGLFAMRLPNVLSFPIYGYFVFKTLGLFANPRLRLLVFLGLMTIDFPMEFFSVCRGYGLSFALMMGAVYQFTQCIQNRSEKRFWLYTLFGVLAIAANLNLLPVVVIGGGLLALNVRNNTRLLVIRMVGILALCAPFVWYGFELKARNLLYYGATNFYNLTLEYCAYLLFHHDIFAWLLIAIVALVLVVFTMGVLRKGSETLSSPKLMLMALTLLSIAAVFVQHWVLGTPYPMDRSAMHLILLLLLSAFMCWGLAHLALRYVLLALAIYFPFDTLLTLDTKAHTLWQMEHIPTRWIETVCEAQSKASPQLIGGSYRSMANWDFMQLQLGCALPFHEQVHEQNLRWAIDTANLSEVGFQRLETDPYSGLALWKQDKSFNMRLLTEHHLKHSGTRHAEYTTLIDTSVSAIGEGVWIQLSLDLQLSDPKREVYIVWGNGKTMQYYPLHRMTHSGSIYGPDVLQLSLCLNTETGTETDVKAFIWNKSTEPFELNEADISVYSIVADNR